ncbi:hypothetical protein PCC7418_1637 [Halothece sp. PCC 7418]|jgi:D-alanyl-D-alanine carboxypeptidase|uniref:hypothetical protein n=1 Tax=Halothece sp. (strain PCC 7418) TaxID=65093 RepID=UPI0002A06543|nr:hypothetical protein [Halothece sp. PCC 7418]AFZ43817.1 hypothetical protein PCC7418_1637 [Halothece sp. PCC 7418]
MTTKRLEEAISKVNQLSESEQNAIADIILAEIADEQYWQEQFDQSQDQLAILAKEALSEYQAKKTHSLDSELEQ